LKGNLDHWPVGRGAFSHAAVNFHVFGAQNILTQIAIGTIDHELVEHQGPAFWGRGRAAHARLGQLPVRDQLRRLSRLANGQGPAKFADKQARLIDLRHHNKIGGFELNRRLAVAQQRRSLVAFDLDPERISADTLRAAAIDPARLGFTRAPAFDGAFGLAGCEFPEAAPAGSQREHDK
jgi:hypothetical protein